MTSYEALINKLNDWCLAQIQDIKFYGEFREQMPNLATITEVYPLVFVSPVSSSGYSQFGTNTIDYTVDVYCVDVIQKNRANINHIVSDCQLILNDIYVYYASDEDEEITIVGTPQLVPLNNADLDYVAGAVMTITFQVEGYTACAIPMTPIVPGVGCADATYSIEDTLGTVLYSGSIESGAVLTQEILDSTAILKDTAGATISTTSILAEGSEIIVAPDVTYTIYDIDGTVLYSGSVVSGGALSEVISNSTVNVRKSDNVLISSVSVEAQATDNYVVTDSVVSNSDSSYTANVKATDSLVLPDININLNGGAFLTVPSGASQDISLIDQDGVDIVPYSVVSDVITVDRAKWLYLATGSSAAANLQIRTKTSEQFVVDWGQGANTTTANNGTATKTYSPNFVGLVKIKPLTTSINALDGVLSNSGAWAFDLSDLKEQVPNLTYQVYFSGNLMTLTGDIANLPSGLTYQVLFSGSLMTLTGDIANLPSSLTYQVFFQGSLMTISGDIANLPSGLTYQVYFLGNLMTISGDIANLPSALTYQVLLFGNLMTLSGDIANLPSGLTYQVWIQGSTLMTLTGDIANLPSGLTYGVYFGGYAMTLSGDIANLPSGLTYQVYFESNLMTLTGDIANLPSGLTYRVLFLSNLMTLTGDIANLPSGLTYQVYFSGNLMTLTGDIANLPANITYLYLATNLATYTYTAGRVWKNMSMVYVRPAVGYMTATEVDNIFIDLDNSPLNTGAGTHDLRGNCAAPTAASLAARNSLVVKGKTVLHN